MWISTHDLVGKSHHATDGVASHLQSGVISYTYDLWEGTHTYYLVEQSHHINAGVTEPWWEKPTHGHDKQ